MYTKYSRLICLLFCIFTLLCGCDNNSPPYEANATLIVNGKDVTSNHYVRVDSENEEYEIPLVTVMEALGADVQWTSRKKATITLDGITYFLNIHTAELIPADRNVNMIAAPPGAYSDGYYYTVENDIILSCTRINHILVTHGMWVSVDYENSVVTVYPNPNNKVYY